MIRLFANANYDFIRWRRWAYGLTAAIILPGFSLFLVRGLNYSIEFTGRTLIQVHTPAPVGSERLRQELDAAGSPERPGPPLRAAHSLGAPRRRVGGHPPSSTRPAAAAGGSPPAPRTGPPARG